MLSSALVSTFVISSPVVSTGVTLSSVLAGSVVFDVTFSAVVSADVAFSVVVSFSTSISTVLPSVSKPFNSAVILIVCLPGLSKVYVIVEAAGYLLYSPPST